jgi:predicted  nucleic acid-binding Zn-ribbon protein
VDFRSLLPVQAIDHRLSQLAHRKAQLPERASADAAKRALDSARAEEKKLTKRAAEITAEINRLELRGKELDAKKVKYESQLKSVVVMREVEALQHEISTINTEHSSLDDAELVLLVENERLERALATLRAEVPILDSAANDTATALASAISAVDADIAAANDERLRLSAGVDGESLALYEQVRSRMSSAAVAELAKGSCGGCHTSISPKEQAELKKVADSTDARCPYCSCLLVV